jgi:hypothetical protein
VSPYGDLLRVLAGLAVEEILLGCVRLRRVLLGDVALALLDVLPREAITYRGALRLGTRRPASDLGGGRAGLDLLRLVRRSFGLECRRELVRLLLRGRRLLLAGSSS